MASLTKRQRSNDARILYGICPAKDCQAKLYFPCYDTSIECTSCGQRHDRDNLNNVQEVTDYDVAVRDLLKDLLLGKLKEKKGFDSVKVLGLSNYVCKLISPILTYYGMDKESGKARLLSEMGKGEVFDVAILGDRAFLIEEDKLDTAEYGKDRTGGVGYLADTLKDIAAFNNNETRLVPIHADGDGHCLVHAVSRALVGRELFWHALRVNLMNHIRNNLQRYQMLFQDFVDKDEWNSIIEECDPEYIPPEGEAVGLRNIHIFGLANVLRRPIILLDAKSGMNSFGDYSGVFLPGLTPPDQCRGKDGTLNKPLCIAWSSLGHNHYIPVVGIKGRAPAVLPAYMVQKSWGMPREEIKKYIEFDNMHRCVVGGDKCLSDRYLRQLVSTMEEVFLKKNDVSAGLVADVRHYIFKSSGVVGIHPDDVVLATLNAVSEKRLYRCCTCQALIEYQLSRDLFVRGGSLYQLAISIHGKLDPSKMYSFPLQGAICSYDADMDCLIPNTERSQPKYCAFCKGEQVRLVRADGSVVYKDMDRTRTPSTGGQCTCGYKHYYDGKEYDNLPEIYPISLQWGGKNVTENIAWFQHESDPTLNSNVFEVAQSVVQKHFPGEFGSERLVQRVVDTILSQTARSSKPSDDQDVFKEEADAWSAETASKIILTGHKKKTIHKEELMMSEKEKEVRKKVQANAPKMQQRKTAELAAQKAAQAKAKDSKHSQSTSGRPSSASGPSGITASTSGSTSSMESSSESLPGTSGTQLVREKKVRLSTSDGRQAMLTLVKDVTYSELQELIQGATGVKPVLQKIRVGHPPKLLEAPVEGQEDNMVELHHGDKLMLEVLPDATERAPDLGHLSSSTRSSRGSWGNFEEAAQSQSADRMLQALKDVPHTGDSIDQTIASIAVLCAVTGKDVWTYAQSAPHLFSVGGLFYSQVKRDIGLVDGKHYQLEFFPGKVFQYSAKDDKLLLCLEPYGHYAVEPNIEQRVKEGGFHQATLSAQRQEVKFGASGAIHQGQERRAFSGQGHSLKAADDRMPPDLAFSGRKPHTRGFHDLCGVPGKRQDSITEEPDDMQVDETGKDTTSPENKYQRLGPGYSVLESSRAANSTNANLEMFRALAASIEKTLSEDIAEEDETASTPSSPKDDIPETVQTGISTPGDVEKADLMDVKETSTNDTVTNPDIPEVPEDSVMQKDATESLPVSAAASGDLVTDCQRTSKDAMSMDKDTNVCQEDETVICMSCKDEEMPGTETVAELSNETNNIVEMEEVAQETEQNNREMIAVDAAPDGSSSVVDTVMCMSEGGDKTDGENVPEKMDEDGDNGAEQSEGIISNTDNDKCAMDDSSTVKE